MILNEILSFFLGFYYFLLSYGMDSLTNCAICSVIYLSENIKCFDKTANGC